MKWIKVGKGYGKMRAHKANDITSLNIGRYVNDQNFRAAFDGEE